MPPRISYLLETSLYVEDLERARTFYARVLGLQPLLQEPRMVALELPGPAVLLLFARGGSTHPTEAPGGTIPPHDATGRQHLCLAIPAAALLEWERHLLTEHVPIESRVIQSHGGTSLYFRDPDHHSLELATPGLWPNH